MARVNERNLVFCIEQLVDVVCSLDGRLRGRQLRSIHTAACAKKFSSRWDVKWEMPNASSDENMTVIMACNMDYDILASMCFSRTYAECPRDRALVDGHHLAGKPVNNHYDDFITGN